jgi:hypothetical protein
MNDHMGCMRHTLRVQEYVGAQVSGSGPMGVHLAADDRKTGRSLDSQPKPPPPLPPLACRHPLPCFPARTLVDTFPEQAN